jgi:hypothetical protein
MTAVIETLDLLLRKTGENGHDRALIFRMKAGTLSGAILPARLTRCGLRWNTSGT